MPSGNQEPSNTCLGLSLELLAATCVAQPLPDWAYLANDQGLVPREAAQPYS